MTQSTILFTTLAVIAGLGVGYWFGWVFDPKRTYMMVIGYVVAMVALLDAMHDSSDEVKTMVWGEAA